jgi:hypothetical protein
MPNNRQKNNKFIPDVNKVRIFQIGFNKCGTRTLFNFFQKNNVPSVHYDGGQIAGSLYRHYQNKDPLIDIRYRKKVFFADMEDIYRSQYPLYGQHLYKQLDQEYNNSFFILNTRNKEKWLRSRILHENGSYLQYISDKMGLSKRQVVRNWNNEWEDHHLSVIDYFRDKPGKLLIFNIETDKIGKLIKFFGGVFNLNPSYYIHVGKSSSYFNINDLDEETKLIYSEYTRKKNEN